MPRNQEVAATDAALAQMYDQLAGRVQQGLGVQQQNFRTAQKSVGQAYDDMTNQLTGQARATQGGLSSEFRGLGIGAATDSATTHLRGQLNQALISAARRRSTEISGLAQQSASYSAAGMGGVANIRREGAQVRSDVTRALEEAIASMEAEKARVKGELDLANLQGQIGLEQTRMQTNAQMTEARLRLKAMELEFAQAQYNASQSGDPLEGLRAENLALEIAERRQRLEQGPESEWDERGQGGLQRFLTNESDWWREHAGPRFQAELMDIIEQSSSQAVNPASAAAGIDDPFDIAMDMVNRSSLGANNRNGLRMALQIYFGKA